MSDIPYKDKINPRTKSIGIIILLLIIGVIVGFVVSSLSINYVSQRIEELNPSFQLLVRAFVDMYTLDTVITCINILLLLGLFVIYVNTFYKTQSSFILGLMVFVGILFIQAIFSLPVLHVTITYNLSLFNIIPNMFEAIALVIMLYLSME
jgi:hypothetical protein